MLLRVASYTISIQTIWNSKLAIKGASLGVSVKEKCSYTLPVPEFNRGNTSELLILNYEFNLCP